MFGIGSSVFTFAAFIVALIIIVQAIRVVPQQHAWVIERLGRFHAVLEPGLNFVIPFVDRLAYRHDLREIPLDIPPQVCITKDNTQLQVDGISISRSPIPSSRLTARRITCRDPRRADAVAERDRPMELDRRSRSATDQRVGRERARRRGRRRGASRCCATKSRILTPPAEILRSMQAQITAQREKRAVIATSEGKRQEQINLAEGARQAAIAKSEGEKQAEINVAQGQAGAILAIAEANAKAIRQVAEAIAEPGGIGAVNLKVAEQYIEQFGNLARTNNTLILPTNVADVAGVIATALSVGKTQKPS
jgi:regulator of protease activity HflC (stomatin/prohibitin superfamily)